MATKNVGVLRGVLSLTLLSLGYSFLMYAYMLCAYPPYTCFHGGEFTVSLSAGLLCLIGWAVSKRKDIKGRGGLDT